MMNNTMKVKLMTALRTSGIGKFERIWRDVKKQEVDRVKSRHSLTLASKSVTQPKEA